MQPSICISICLMLMLHATLVHFVDASKDEPYSGTNDVFNCNNLCPFAGDGVCDDGGPNSKTAFCMYGSDCRDCGMRAPYTRAPTSLKITHSPTQRWTPVPEPGSGDQGTPSVSLTHVPSTTPTVPQSRLRTSAPVAAGGDYQGATKKPTTPTHRPTTVRPTTKTPTTREPTAHPTTRNRRRQNANKKAARRKKKARSG